MSAPESDTEHRRRMDVEQRLKELESQYESRANARADMDRRLAALEKSNERIVALLEGDKYCHPPKPGMVEHVEHVAATVFGVFGDPSERGLQSKVSALEEHNRDQERMANILEGQRRERQRMKALFYGAWIFVSAVIVEYCKSWFEGGKKNP